MKNRNNIIATIIISIVALFFSGYALREYNHARFYDNSLERASRDLAIIERVFFYLTMEDETFFKYARTGGMNMWMKMDQFSLTPVNYTNYFRNHYRLKEYCDSFFCSDTAYDLQNALSWRQKEQKAFLDLRYAIDQYNSIDLLKCNPQETRCQIKELFTRFREAGDILDDRLTSSDKHIYIVSKDDWNFNE